MTKQRESGITWTEETWNPVRGCSRISKGCMNCYAEGIANRFKGAGQPYEGLIASTGQWNGTVRMIEDKLLEPIRWKRPRLIFVNSMSDLFHESLTDDQIDQVFGVMWACLGSDHTFQVLTKRAKRMHDYMKQDRRSDWASWAAHYGGGIDPDGIHDQTAYAEEPHPRIWLGVSIEDQATADERIPYLLDTPAAVRWISAEPLLGAVDLTRVMHTLHRDWNYCWDALSGTRVHKCGGTYGNPKLDWVVVGGESGTGARPMHPEWARSLRDQCVAAGVPFHFKQHGEWVEAKLHPRGENSYVVVGSRSFTEKEWRVFDDGQIMARIGKKAAGRLLSGRTWDEYPKGYTRPTNKRTNKDEQANTDVKDQPQGPEARGTA